MGAEKRAILISIDGLWPELYLNRRPERALLPQLARSGAFARGVRPVYPSVTLTNHASLATGTYPDRHGIVANTRFSPERVFAWRNYESQDWCTDSSLLRAKPIWELATERGLSTALLRWPTSRGARARWVVPEVFQVFRGDLRDSWDHLEESTSPALMNELRRIPPFGGPDEHEVLDDWTCGSAEHLLLTRSPGLTLVHFTSLDHTVHLHGRASPEARRTVERIEEWLARLLSAIDLRSTLVLIVGDHGFLDYTKKVYINEIFLRRGWIRIRNGRILEWKAIAQTNCGQAPVYVNTPGIEDQVLRALQEHARAGIFRVLSRDDLRRLRTQPQALCAVDCREGFSLGQRLEGPLIEEFPDVRGEHGYLPEHPLLHSGLIALGEGSCPGRDLGQLSILDIAPTLAQHLEFPMPEGQRDGTAIPFR